MGLRGCLAAIKAPTSGKIRKEAPATWPMRERLASQLPGTFAERARANSRTLTTNKPTERPASDQANHAARRGLNALPVLLVDEATARRVPAARSHARTIATRHSTVPGRSHRATS